MSHCEQRRAEAVKPLRDELTLLPSHHARDVRSLYAVWRCVQNNTHLNSLLALHSASPNPPPDDEAVFLRENDISSGFDTAALALRPSPPPALTPTTPEQDASIPVALLSTGPAEPPPDVQDLPEIETASGVVPEPPRPEAAVLPEPVLAPAVQEPPFNLAILDSQPVPSRALNQPAPTDPDGPDGAPAQIAPPLPEEDANLPASTQQSLQRQAPEQPATTVHLPSEEFQEEHLREREVEQNRRRQSDAESKGSQRLQPPQGELASSPSSTVGPYSAATPLPLQDSPDTSPDSEGAQLEMLPPKELQPSPEQQREREEHDRLLEAQKEIARQQALGSVAATPDEQLRWEEREAAAREAEEQAARDDVAGPEPDRKDARSSTEAGTVVEEMQLDSVPAGSAQPARKEMRQVPESEQSLASDQTNDNIAEAGSRNMPLESPADAAKPEASSASGRPARMTTRVSSGALRQKSVSEILGQSQSPPLGLSMSARKEVMSPESISPMTQRHPQDTFSAALSSSAQASRHHRALPSRTPSTPQPALDQLELLKGASEDPERDYLEPLFRIQAHESPNSGTKVLPELIRVAPKVLSTEDHFTALHERLDFRMLRRIYQLQNANKWSLRQMDNCAEPKQPVTHHDHMMAEMKWLRKDFKAERKLKKNICAWLAQRCAEWVAADVSGRKRLQIRSGPMVPKQNVDPTEAVPELEQAGDSALEDDVTPPTPRARSPLQTTVVVAPELAGLVQDLRKAGKLDKALVSLPKTGLLDQELKHESQPVTLVSKFINGKILPKSTGPSLKRSRYDYEDEAAIRESERSSKRRRDEEFFRAEDLGCALFDPENKPIRDRLHSNNAFHPPSELLMPPTHFYEFRNGSQWIWEDDQKLRKLAKEYSFNWSLIADEMALPSRYKGSAERRTPWECFERWVELESLPADMRKTVYFKTWYLRLEQSQQAAERRYQAQVTALQQQAAQNGGQAHIPIRRRTVPTRVEKRRSARYLWMVDGFKKLAKKREQAAWKQAEATRAAAQRKSTTEANQPKMVRMTPQEFSKKRHERDVQLQEAQRAHRTKMIEAQQQRQLATARASQSQQQQAGPNGVPVQQRLQAANASIQQAQMQANGQQAPSVNGQASMQQQLRPGVPMTNQRGGHLAPPQVGVQGMSQAQLQARAAMAQHSSMSQMAQPSTQGVNPQYAAQQYQMQNGNMPSPGGNFTTQQQLQQNQALLQAFQQQRHANGGQNPNMSQSAGVQQMSGPPSMPPPPTPQTAPQQLSSGHVPQIIAIQTQLRANNPGLTDDQLKAMATQQMKVQSQSSSQARQNAMNAAAGISPQQGHTGMQQQFNQGSYQRNGQQMPSGVSGMYMNGDANGQQSSMSPVTSSSSPSQQMYAQKMWHRQQMQMQQMQHMQSPNTTHAQLNGSPNVAHTSPNLAPSSPSMQYATQGGQMSANMANMNGQRPPSRSATPQMQRLGSSGSGVAAMGNEMQSPGALQGSPRNVMANVAR